MKVLDANFLIDYLKGNEATKEFYEANGGKSERWARPVGTLVRSALNSI